MLNINQNTKHTSNTFAIDGIEYNKALTTTYNNNLKKDDCCFNK